MRNFMSQSLDVDAFVERAHLLRKLGETIVVTNGCYDLLHVGHLMTLWEAATYGRVFVCVNDDASVRGLKGDDRPYTVGKHRAMIIAALEAVECATIFESEAHLASIYKRIEPDVLVKGADYEGKDVTGSDYADRLVLCPIFHDEEEDVTLSTTAMLERIRS